MHVCLCVPIVPCNLPVLTPGSILPSFIVCLHLPMFKSAPEFSFQVFSSNFIVIAFMPAGSLSHIHL